MPETYERTNTYERVVDGEVVERVQPLDGDYEDTRLGLLALDGKDGWRLVGAEPEQSTEEPAENMPEDIPDVDQGTPAAAEPSTPGPDPMPARPARARKEK